MKEIIKVIFMGTPEFGAKSLEALINDQAFSLIAVISQPDKPVGRKQILTPPAIKKIALKHQIQVYQPNKIKTEAELIKNLNPDLIVVAAYGQIIPKIILDIPKYGCINIHGSLLPKYRGASCIQAPILNGDRKSGLTIMKMDEGLDTGGILKQKKIKLAKDETASSLHDKLAELGPKLLIPTLKKYITGKLKLKKQNNKKSSYVRMMRKDSGHIDWHKPAIEIERIIRALNPWPGAYSYLNNQDLQINNILFKILAVRPKPVKTKKYHVGEIFYHESALAVKCGDNKALIVIKLQLEGKKVMETDDFLRGNNTIVGSVLK